MNVAKHLHPLERQVLPLLKTPQTVEALARSAKLPSVSVVRALQWLEKKGLVLLEKTKTKNWVPTQKGKAIKELPEKVLLQIVQKKPHPVKDLHLVEGGQAAVGILRQKGFIRIDKGLVKATAKAQHAEFPAESFLKKLPVSADQNREIGLGLQRRGLVTIEESTVTKAYITATGKKVVAKGIKEYVDALTPDMIRTKSWQGKTFRAFDMDSLAPRLNAGKYQPYKRFLDKVRQAFIAMGFAEMTGPVVESEFWDMDALYMPQFHSARDIHEGYYVKNAPPASIPAELLRNVKQAHETGVENSTGWQYAFDSKKSKRQLLRTQGTACSARMLASPDLTIPGKYFGMTRCFRYDVIDATHLPDFTQVEGIVVDESLSLRHLFGLLTEFAKTFCETDKIKLVPGYFPFTEPSVELFAKHSRLGWIELGGAGLFRPEVVKPLTGKNVPVIAWGLGIDRIGMFQLGIKDIRNLFSKDLAFLRGAKVV